MPTGGLPFRLAQWGCYNRRPDEPMEVLMDKAHAMGAVIFVIMMIALIRSFLPAWMRSDRPLWPFSFELTDYVKSGDLPPTSHDGHCSPSSSSGDGGSCGNGDSGGGGGA